MMHKKIRKPIKINYNPKKNKKLKVSDTCKTMKRSTKKTNQTDLFYKNLRSKVREDEN